MWKRLGRLCPGIHSTGMNSIAVQHPVQSMFVATVLSEVNLTP